MKDIPLKSKHTNTRLVRSPRSSFFVKNKNHLQQSQAVKPFFQPKSILQKMESEKEEDVEQSIQKIENNAVLPNHSKVFFDASGPKQFKSKIPVFQLQLSKEDQVALKTFKQLGFDGQWIKALEFLRSTYGIGTAAEYEFEIDNLEAVGGHHYASTSVHPKKKMSLVKVDTSKILELLTTNKKGGFQALVSTLRHEYAHVIQYNELISKVESGEWQEGDVEKFLASEDLHEFLAYSEEILQSYTLGKGQIKSAPNLEGGELDLAFTRAKKHYHKLSKEDKKQQRKRYEEMKDMYETLVVFVEYTDFIALVMDLEKLVNKPGFEEKLLAFEKLIKGFPKLEGEREKVMKPFVDKAMAAIEKHSVNEK